MQIINGIKTLTGDGSFPFTASIDGTDIIVRDVYSTFFGGDSDPEDNGETASGLLTKGNPSIMGCALPMHGEGCSATEGSPLPKMPYRETMVRIWSHATGLTVTVPVIDLGPAKAATTNPEQPHAIDLTIAAFQALGLHLSAGIALVDYRVEGGAAYVPS